MDTLGHIRVTRSTGEEHIRSATSALAPSLLGFWQWSTSDLLSNATLGRFAEYLVACDLGVASGVRGDWDAYDLITDNGVKIEVKSASYMQSWKQTRLSNIAFGIAPFFAWNPESNEYGAAKKRQANVYVFCLLDHRDKLTVDPVDRGQWQFFVFPTDVLDSQCPSQKSIGLKRLKKLKPMLAQFGQIKILVHSVAEQGL